ncbi:MAG: hypothetical protein SOR59_02985 [Lachnospiraceae bacterium]|nr:hypothetical protein [Lachnospiraceae bacterium]
MREKLYLYQFKNKYMNNMKHIRKQVERKYYFTITQMVEDYLSQI